MSFAEAECNLFDPTGASGVTGNIKFSQYSEREIVTYRGSVNGLTEGKHGFHTHALSDIDKDCKGAGGHFNPDDVDHAGPDHPVRHAGDHGNIVANKDGLATIDMKVVGVSLNKGDKNIIGRAIVVHAGEDDLGLGGDAGSLKTGNAGGRVACCVINPIKASKRSHRSDLKHHDPLDEDTVMFLSS